MKRAIVAVTLLLAMLGCGGGSSSSTSTRSGIKNRAFVTNSFSGILQIIDASNDTLSNFSINLSTTPTFMTLSPGRELTLVFNSGDNSVSVVTNSTETVAGSITLPSFSDGIAAKDVNVGFAAVRNDPVTGQSDIGAVLVLDLAKFAVLNTVAVPRARRIVMSHNGSRLLVFSDNSNSVFVIDTAAAATDTTYKATEITGFDHPAWGVFTSDDSKAFIINCGAECGGTNAGVQPLTIGATAPGTAVPVSAGTTALLNNNTLFVAGTRGGAAGQGVLNAFDVSSGVPVATSVKNVAISDGYHLPMALASNNKLFVGSSNCTNLPGSASPTGCLTIFDTSANTAVVDQAKGFVTGLQPITNRNVVYVIEGGELRIYDTTTSTETTHGFIDIVGAASDIKAVDQQ